MKTITNILLLVIAIIIVGCNEQKDPRIHVRREVKSDSLISNIVTRPISRAFSNLIGEGIEINEGITKRNKAGYLELHVNGYNRSYKTKRFRYKVDWIDESGFVIQTKTSVWLPASAMGKSPFSIKAVAPRPEAVDFRMDTKKWE